MGPSDSLEFRRFPDLVIKYSVDRMTLGQCNAPPSFRVLSASRISHSLEFRIFTPTSSAICANSIWLENTTG